MTQIEININAKSCFYVGLGIAVGLAIFEVTKIFLQMWLMNYYF